MTGSALDRAFQRTVAFMIVFGWFLFKWSERTMRRILDA